MICQHELWAVYGIGTDLSTDNGPTVLEEGIIGPFFCKEHAEEWIKAEIEATSSPDGIVYKYKVKRMQSTYRREGY